MAKYGKYGWTPRQMERINERRAARGQEELRNLQYEDRPQMERQRQSARPLPMQDEDEMSLTEKQAERTKEFRKQFSPKGSMAAEYEVKNKSSGLMKRGVKGGVGTSMMQDSYNQFTA